MPVSYLQVVQAALVENPDGFARVLLADENAFAFLQNLGGSKPYGQWHDGGDVAVLRGSKGKRNFKTSRNLQPTAPL